MNRDNENRKDNQRKLSTLIRYFKQVIRVFDKQSDPDTVLGSQYIPLNKAQAYACGCPAAAAETALRFQEINDRIIVIGASFGGTLALTEILGGFPENCPPTLITQHMSPGAMDAFAAHLNRTSKPEVRVARDGDVPRRGLVLVAPGARHMALRKEGQVHYVRVFEGSPVNFQRPSVDVLFHSAARAAGKQAIGVLLTGMGKDGAMGLNNMHQSGAYTVAQDEATSAMFGMPGAAVALGAVSKVLPLSRIAAHVLKQANIPQSDTEARLIPLHSCGSAHYSAAN